MHRAIRRRQRVMLAQALGAKLADIDRVVLPAAHRNRLAIPHSDLHAASDRAITAGGFDPALRRATRRGVAERGIVGVGVLAAKSVDTEQPLNPHFSELHSG